MRRVYEAGTPFRTRDGRDGTAFGAWIKMATIESTEVLADSGFDFAVVDMEHTLLSMESVYQHIVVGTGLGMQMLVRVPDASGSVIGRVLDAGASGVIVPHVDTAADAMRAARSCSFPPSGVRGSGGTSRNGRWGARPRTDYLADVGLCVPQIESCASVRDIDEILATEGIGAVMLGPADLALDSACHPAAQSVSQQSAAVLEAARKAHVVVGTACAGAAAADAVVNGYDFVICANDSTLLSDAARATVSQLHSIHMPVSDLDRVRQ